MAFSVQTRMFRIVMVSVGTVLLATFGGCPLPPDGDAPGRDQPAVEEFDLPEDATAARIRGGSELVYVVPDESDFEYAFFLAEPNEPRSDHVLVTTVPAEQLGFGAGDMLVAAQSVSFANDLERATIGFEDRSYLLDADPDATAQLIGTFEVTPLTVSGAPVLNPAIDPLGDRLAFETPEGLVGTGRIDTGGSIRDFGVLGTGVNPVFGFDSTLGFADPANNRFFVDDFDRGTRTTFDFDDVDDSDFGTPFESAEAGFTPDRIDTVARFVGTSPLNIETDSFRF